MWIPLLLGAAILGEPPRFEGYTVTHWTPTSALKDQQSTGTCWSFATTSFLETESMRLGRPPVSLSPIFYVAPAYREKAERFVSRKGKSYFASGDLTFSVLEGYRRFGAVPEVAYNGIIKGDTRLDHLEMDDLLLAMVTSVGASGYGRIKPNAWRIAFDATLAAYLGRPPSQFEFEGARYTPRSFADERVAIDPDKYVEVTSYSHLAANGFSPLEIPANYRKRRYLNLPFRDFARVVDVALAAGFSLAWDGDVSEPGWKDAAGTAHLPDGVGVDAELRDRHFRSGKTADEHNMHLVGRATDERNEVYYVLKNSEGPNANGGFVLMHREYLLLKTVSLLVHQDALPADVRRRVRRLKPRGG